MEREQNQQFEDVRNAQQRWIFKRPLNEIGIEATVRFALELGLPVLIPKYIEEQPGFIERVNKLRMEIKLSEDNDRNRMSGQWRIDY